MSDKRVLTISAIVLVAVVMGMSAMAPAFAPGPPVVPPVTPDPGGTPDVNCEDLEALLAILLARDVITPQEAEDILTEAGCPV